MESHVEQQNANMSITLYKNRLATLKDPVKTLQNVRNGNLNEIITLPSVSFKKSLRN